MIVRPDCADLPYFLRAYFAFKMGLPFGYSICSRGGGGAAPRCGTWLSIQSAGGTGMAPVVQNAASPSEPSLQPAAPAPTQRLGLVASFARYLPNLANGVHSASGRTLLNDNNTDYYPVPLTQETLRPGVVYHDPYGHVLMIVRRVPEANGEAGIILAVDGQPDGTVARKRFWRGNFLFAQDPALGGPGFKRFRPIVRGTDGIPAAADQRTDIEEPALHHPISRSIRRSSVSKPFTTGWTRCRTAPQPLDPARADGGDAIGVARRAGEGAGDVGRERPEVPGQRQGRGVDAGRPDDLRDDRGVGGLLDTGSAISAC